MPDIKYTPERIAGMREQTIPHVVAPDLTCPDIDELGNEIESLCLKCGVDFKSFIPSIETVRSSNSQLRTLGMRAHKMAKDILKERNEGLAEISALQTRLASAEEGLALMNSEGATHDTI